MAGKDKCQQPTDIENGLVVDKGKEVREGRIESLGLADANYYI